MSMVVVGGITAENIDYSDLINRWLPLVVAFVLGLSFLLLTVVFRSVVLSITAVLLNLLSVGAAYGLLVLVFQNGVGANLLGFPASGSHRGLGSPFLVLGSVRTVDGLPRVPASRIRERYATSGDTDDAVVHGIAATGRIITGAALIIVVVFAGFAAGQLVMFQQMGFGVAIALLVDATLIRMVVVPAVMAILGRWNWYLPSWLGWLPEFHVEGDPVDHTLDDYAARRKAARGALGLSANPRYIERGESPMSVTTAAGILLIACTTWRLTLFLRTLAATFDYPDILRRPSSEVLERFQRRWHATHRFLVDLRAHGSRARAIGGACLRCSTRRLSDIALSRCDARCACRARAVSRNHPLAVSRPIPGSRLHRFGLNTSSTRSCRRSVPVVQPLPRGCGW